MGQATILRKMTLKSVFHAGVMEGISVQQAIAQNRHTFLRWIYYNYSGITFTDDEWALLCSLESQRPGT